MTLFAGLVAGQTNASSALRPVALRMTATDAELTFSLVNTFRRAVTGYTIQVWAFREGVPRTVCRLRSDTQISSAALEIPVRNACALPRDPESGEPLAYTARLSAVRVDGSWISNETMPVSRR